MDLLSIFLIATSVCAFVYTIQLVYLDRIRLRSGIIAEITSRKRARLLRAGPVVCSILATIALVCVPLLGKSRSEGCLQENNEINPDVGGIGVLLGLFLPCLVLLVVLILGHFTVHTSGAKELCMAQCASKLRRELEAILDLTQHRLAVSHHQSCQGDVRAKRSRACHRSVQC